MKNLSTVWYVHVQTPLKATKKKCCVCVWSSVTLWSFFSAVLLWLISASWPCRHDASFSQHTWRASQEELAQPILTGQKREKERKRKKVIVVSQQHIPVLMFSHPTHIWALFIYLGLDPFHIFLCPFNDLLNPFFIFLCAVCQEVLLVMCVLWCQLHIIHSFWGGGVQVPFVCNCSSRL